jgi:alpha-galactosidase
LSLPYGGTVTALGFYLYVGNPVTFSMGIYSDLNGNPYRLLAQSAPVSTAVDNAWATVPVTVALGPGSYWPVVFGNGLAYNVNYNQLTPAPTHLFQHVNSTYELNSLPLWFHNASVPLLPIVADTNIVMYLVPFPQNNWKFTPSNTPTGSPTLTPFPVGTFTVTPTWTPKPELYNANVGLVPLMSYCDWGNNMDSIPINTVSSADVTQIADAMVTNGMLAAGYNYIMLDDGWENATRVDGHLVPDTTRFPDGLACIQYCHSRGIKFGLYTSRTSGTCGGNLGSYAFEVADGNYLASQGLDYFKEDGNCSGTSGDAGTGFQLMANTLLNNPSGNTNIWFDICASGLIPSGWGAVGGFANSWRTGDDSQPSWANFIATMGQAQACAYLSSPGRIMNADEFWAGEESNSQPEVEQATEFSMKCMLSSMLMAALDPRTASSMGLSIACNSELIAIDQDELQMGPQVISTSDSGACTVFSKTVNDPVHALLGMLSQRKAVAFLNTDSTPQTMIANFGQCGLPNGWYSVRDCWIHQPLGKFYNYFSCVVASHATTVITVAP